MTPRLAQGAQQLEHVRLAGKRPLGSVVVTDEPLVANMLSGSGFFVLRVNAGVYDMRPVRGLDVLAVLVGSDVLGVLASIDEAQPARLYALIGEDVLDLLDIVLEGWRRLAGEGAVHG